MIARARENSEVVMKFTQTNQLVVFEPDGIGPSTVWEYHLFFSPPNVWKSSMAIENPRYKLDYGF
jgi:hypothetical protein